MAGWVYRETKLYIPKNAIRSEMIEKAKQIFDFVFDHDSPIVSISTVISQLEKYESEWELFPREACEIAKINNDKLSAFLRK